MVTSLVCQQTNLPLSEAVYVGEAGVNPFYSLVELKKRGDEFVLIQVIYAAKY